MPAFDPVRDAVLNSPVDQAPTPHPLASPSLARRATDLSVLLNSDTRQPGLPTPPPTRSTLSHLLHTSNINTEEKLAASEPFGRRSSYTDPNSSYFSYQVPSTSRSQIPSPHRHRSPSPRPGSSSRQQLIDSPVSRTSFPSRPSSSSSSTFPPPQTNRNTASPVMVPPPTPPPPTIPYNPTRRLTAPGSVLIPLTPTEMEFYKNFRGQGAARLSKRKRTMSNEPDGANEPPRKKLAGDVGVVVEHYNSRPDVGVVQRLESPILGLKNFNNWVKSVLITRFAHPVLSKGSTSNGYSGPGRGRGGGAGKVLDMGCGKGGDMTKWAKARVREVFAVDIAAISVDQARSRWESMRGPRFDASFAALDCYTEPLSKAFPPAKLAQPFDVVSMQFCMHYAFETVQKARCMLENVSRYLRTGGVFIGTIPNAEQLLEHLDEIPPNAEELSFGNSVYKIRFEERNERPVFGHKYWFYLQDAVENVPEYIVRWDNFVQMAAEYKLYPIYKEEFHQVFEEHQEHPEFGPLMVRMKVVDANGESAMDEDQWEAANIYIAFAFEKR
ncbi:mRNA capping enzyme-domain-containing protein [Crucibulum laeve]|uniref:mRNA cap guanine-N(7) methyltransferase n=1 Tax=Crucibulum laeve TaxID=68775 RepID=A0A5C3MEQ7_9AGAR|nr:mRNA capping enzyme-domain-containing protein [Crucibulum laeve]